MSQETERTPIGKNDLFEMRFLAGAAVAPDGDRLLYALSEHDADTDTDVSQLFLRDIAGGEARQLTYGQQVNHSPAWSPDGSQIAFVSTRSEKPQIFLLPVDGGEARQLTEMKQGVGGGPVWSPDGSRIAFSAGPDEDSLPEPGKPYRVDRHVYRFDGLGYLDGVVQDIYVVAASGGEPQQLTSDRWMNAQPQWSPAGDRLLYSAAMNPTSFAGLFPGLKMVDLEGEQETLIDESWGSVGGAAWLPDGSGVAFLGTARGKPIGSKPDLYVLKLDGGAPQNRTAGYPFTLGGGLQPDQPAAILMAPVKIAITADGGSAFLRAQIGGAVHILRVALSGPEQVDTIVDGDRYTSLLDLRSDERALFYVASSWNSPADLYMADIEGGSEQRLTSHNEAFLSGRQQPRVERITCPGADNVEVESWLIMPDDDAAPYPLILYIHGGPHSAFGSMYHFDTQMLVGAGYAVLMVNHRASTGYGDAFSTAIKGDWGNLDYADLMAAVDAVIAKGLVDPERMGVCGISGGGNLSTWIVGQTDRFKAAVPENPVTNWVSFYGVSDIGVWFAVEELGGHPHEIPDVYARCSPITYAHRCTTPTLLVQGEHDYRCPAEQSEQFYNVLMANDCVVEMLRLPNSPHVGSIAGPPALRRAQNEALLEWMNRYVLGKEPAADEEE